MRELRSKCCLLNALRQIAHYRLPLVAVRQQILLMMSTLELAWQMRGWRKLIKKRTRKKKNCRSEQQLRQKL